MRAAEPRDIPALLAKLKEQNERDGTKYPLADLFDEHGRQAKNIPLALVIEHAGKIDGGIIFESLGVEMMLIGCSPRVTLMAQWQQNAITYTLRRMGFNWIRCLVTKKILKHLKAPMKEAGFTRDDNRFASFFKEL